MDRRRHRAGLSCRRCSAFSISQLQPAPSSYRFSAVAREAAQTAADSSAYERRASDRRDTPIAPTTRGLPKA